MFEEFKTLYPSRLGGIVQQRLICVLIFKVKEVSWVPV